MNALQWRRRPSRREARVPHSPKTRLSLGWNVHCPSTPSKTRPIPSANIAVSRGRRAIFIVVKRPRARLRAVTEVSYDVQFLIRAPQSRAPAELSRQRLFGLAWSSVASDPPDRQRSAGGVCHGRCRFFPARSGRQSMRGACPANRGYPRTLDSILGVTRHRSDLPLVKRAGLDQSKQPRTAIEAEFVERVARGHGIKAPLPFEYDLNGGQRTVFFD